MEVLGVQRSNEIDMALQLKISQEYQIQIA